MSKAKRKVRLGYLARATNEDTIDLHRLFPVSMLYVLQEFLIWVLFIGLVCVLLMNGRVRAALSPDSLSQWINSPRLISDINTVMVALRDPVILVSFYFFSAILGLLVLLLFRRRYSYVLKHGVLCITKGSLVRERQLIAIAEISDVFVQQKLLDRLFGLADVALCVQGLLTRRAIVIPGLTLENANGLEECLQEAIDNRRAIDQNARSGGS